MRSFEQLTQDEQMQAVDDIIELLISSTANGYTPESLKDYQVILDLIFNLSPPDLVRDRLLQVLDIRRDIYVELLHQAGRIAKAAFYP